MGFQKHAVVPIDTHVFQITASVYMPQLRTKKSVTKAMHEEIGRYYEEYFGSYAGWAHSVLFSAQLKHFNAETTVGKGKTKKTTEETISEKMAVKKPRK
jgi:N-glycosylase/DNA lyase